MIALFLAQILRISVPYVMASLGGALSERAGVINLALEGMLLAGAFAATSAAHVGGGVLGGVLAGALAGALVAAVYALVVLGFRADQVVSGIALNLLIIGLTRYLLQLVFHSASNSPEIPGFSGPIWGNAYALVTILGVAFALLATGIHLMLSGTAFGLRLRAVGEHPWAADSLGVSVLTIRLAAVLGAGVLAGLGGAWLALDTHGFVDKMSGGRGYIALAAVIFGRWRPLGVTSACLLFGFAEALQLHLQTRTALIPRELMQVFPYLLTMVALSGAIGHARKPQALGIPFARD